MKNNENNPVNEWNAATHRLGYLTGGPLESLLVQLARTAASSPSVSAEMPEWTPDKDPADAGAAAFAKMKTTSNS